MTDDEVLAAFAAALKPEQPPRKLLLLECSEIADTWRANLPHTYVDLIRYADGWKLKAVTRCARCRDRGFVSTLWPDQAHPLWTVEIWLKIECGSARMLERHGAAEKYPSHPGCANPLPRPEKRTGQPAG